ncbi:MAG: hypothetical protein A3G93_07690 [Nitrospinae bacterium RIFCSPLOWO2_12_FULL_45_22]|nr:MAG: hypothetical protein A3G93_07690 [Nitrospinae bacterium RIFCSPLOWO2_12_FULL_45_22]
MNKSDEYSDMEDWLKIARKDWERAKRNLKHQDPEAAGFFLQQSVEKYLKAFLLRCGWKLKKIHELDALLDEAIRYNSELQNFYLLCERITGYYFADRYPPLGDLELTCEDIEKDLEEAKSFIKTMFPEEKLNG